MASCFVHPAVAATGTCDACGKPVCMRCTKGTLDGFMCPPCAHRRYGRRKLIVGLKVAAIAAVVIAVAVGGLMVVGRGNRTSKPPVPKVRDPDPTVAALLDSRDLAPCDRKLVRQLADALSKLDRYAEVVEHGNAFFAKCGPFPRLEWTVVHALQQLGRYAEAVKHSTVIIEDNPFDSDFWWWRGEDLVRSKQHAAALADYRQSFANAQRPEAARFPAGRILDAADPAGRPCEGVFALRYFVEVQGGDLSGSLERRAAGPGGERRVRRQGWPRHRDLVAERRRRHDPRRRHERRRDRAVHRRRSDRHHRGQPGLRRPGRPGGWRSGWRHGRRQRSQGRHPDDRGDRGRGDLGRRRRRAGGRRASDRRRRRPRAVVPVAVPGARARRRDHGRRGRAVARRRRGPASAGASSAPRKEIVSAGRAFDSP
jgi:hypothetical protein